ncbi:hypothetical protein AB4Z42_00525 [Mycobacterium sp. 2YAF39]|uniref:hypothetical protein n=1 Tax=Mycobacterium sp. 2YAF39 TaxID=3233033 RepID=UPI003F98022B
MTAYSDRDDDKLSVGAAQISQMAQDLQDRGVTTLRGAISPGWIATAREEIEAYIERHGPGDHDLFDLDAWECPTARSLAENPDMESLLATLANTSSSGPAGQGTYDRRVLRIHDGSTGVIPYLWHFDANTITALIPIIVPGDDSGHFAALPPMRPNRRSVLSTVQERIQFGKDPYPAATKHFEKARDKYTYPLVPGEALIMWGHRTMHCALPWPVGVWRANIVLHYGLPPRSESKPLRAAFALRDALKGRA